MAQIGLEVGLFMNLLISRKKFLGNTGDFLWSYGGYLIVSALCDLCGVTLDESNARNFITDCIESLHDTLKANLSVDGANYSLSFSDDFINEFIEFYLNISGKQYLYNEGDEYEDVTGGIVESERDGYENKGITKNEKNIVLDTKNSQGYSGIKIINPIDLSLYTSIHVDYKITSTIRGNFNWFAGYFQKDNLAYDESKVIKLFLTVSSGNTVTCNPSLTDVNEVGYLTIYASAYGLQSSMVIYKIWLEKKYDIGDSYVKTLEEYKAKYENEPSRIILDSSIVNIKTKWKKEDTDIYIPNGNVENLPNGVKILYGLWVYNTGDQFTEITGGWENYHNDTNWFWSGSCYKGDIEENYLSFSIKQDKSMCSLATSNKINFEEVNKIKITYSRIANTKAYIALQIVDSLETSELSGAKLQVGHDKFTETENLETYNTIEISYPNPITLNGEFYVLVVLWGELAEYKETFRIKSIHIR